MTGGISLDKVVSDHWDQCHDIHPEVYKLTRGQIEELLDAWPMGHYDELKRELRMLREDAPTERIQS